jgi:signal transduction histidine kinase/DNA-binding response OmpR family regulator
MVDDIKTSILIVDDRPDKLTVLTSILEGLGQDLVVARSGREALRRVLERDFAVILLDVNMPDMDGFETASLIRQRKQSAQTPIIFVTAYGDDLHAAQGYSLGAVDYIYAPVVPEILRTKVGVFVDLYLKTEQAKRQAEQRVALAREQALRAAAEEANRRSAFLAEASAALASSLDFEATLRGLCRVLVPFLADLAAVTVAGSPGQPRRSEIAWARPGRGGVDALSVKAAEGPDDPLRQAVERVLISGKPERLEGLDVPYPCAGGGAVETGRLHHALVIPLLARGRALGALTLGLGASGRQFAPADVALAEDLAGRAAIAIDNARLYRDVQEADRRKNEFLAMLAHELRNPLAPIRNAVEVLRVRGTAAAELDWARGLIDRQLAHLVRLVDDLLDVSRITRGKIRLQSEPLDLMTVVARAVETSRPLLEERRHQLTVLPPAQPLWVQGDPVRLAQVLGNLLNNAAKFTENGGRIAVQVECDRGQAVVRVRDSGMGIPPEMLASVFDLFTQADRSLDRSHGGLGIGLTLVRQLVEMHGGRVEAHSEGLNRGSEFVVRLPLLGEAPVEPRLSEKGADLGDSCPKLRVLVVDDNVDGAESLHTLLQLSGHEAQVAHNGPAALDMAASFAPQVVLLDIGLPGMDGYEVARRLRALPGGDRLVLVAATGYGHSEDRRRSRAASFDFHLVKPIDLAELSAIFARTGPPRRPGEPLRAEKKAATPTPAH